MNLVAAAFFTIISKQRTRNLLCGDVEADGLNVLESLTFDHEQADRSKPRIRVT